MNYELDKTNKIRINYSPFSNFQIAEFSNYLPRIPHRICNRIYTLKKIYMIFRIF